MKKILCCVVFLIPFVTFAQGYKIRIGGAGEPEFEIDKIPTGTKFTNEIKTLEIKKMTADNPAKTYTLNTDDESKTFSTDGNFHPLTFSKDIREIGLTVNDENQSIDGGPFVLQKPQNDPVSFPFFSASLS